MPETGFHAGGAKNGKTEVRKEAVQGFDETQAFAPSVFSSSRLGVKCFLILASG
jgi:hypothetical protein